MPDNKLEEIARKYFPTSTYAQWMFNLGLAAIREGRALGLEELESVRSRLAEVEKEREQMRRYIQTQQVKVRMAQDAQCVAESRAEALEQALREINDLRNDIIGRQVIGFSRHVYPLVAILNKAGFEGMSYEEAKKKAEESDRAALKGETR